MTSELTILSDFSLNPLQIVFIIGLVIFQPDVLISLPHPAMAC